MRFFIIFAVGAAILSLELTASKILKPYFGDNLYIWAAILSATLLCMALGYALGGRISRKFSHGAQSFFYNHAPATSAIAIMIVAAFYPLVFKSMALGSLVMGCFAAAALLIGPPLIMLAGMPPLLVALHRQPPPMTREEAERKAKAEKKKKKKKAKTIEPPPQKLTEKTGDDAGAGRIFTFETLGAITGVLLTAFVLMPNFSSYQSYMIIGGFLAVVSVLGTLTDMHLNPAARMHTRRLAAVVMLTWFCLYGISFANGGNPVAITAQDGFFIRETVNSPFGGIKVVDFDDMGGKGWRRVMLNQGIAQAEMDSVTRPTRLYQFYLAGMAGRMAPKGTKALVLGIGGGIIPMEITHIGPDVDAVEIDPRITQLARDDFVLRDGHVTVYEQDARTFMRHCPEKYGAVAIDLFRGDGVPEHLVTREFFSDIRKCMDDKGGLVLNIMYNDLNAPPVMALLATIRDVFGRVAFTYPDTPKDEDAKDAERIVNAYVFTSLNEDLDLTRLKPGAARIPFTFYPELEGLANNVKVYGPDAPELEGIRPMTDENNPWRQLSAPFAADFRRFTLMHLHRALLVD